MTAQIKPTQTFTIILPNLIHKSRKKLERARSSRRLHRLLTAGHRIIIKGFAHPACPQRECPGLAFFSNFLGIFI